jgi:hypothetical protein
MSHQELFERIAAVYPEDGEIMRSHHTVCEHGRFPFYQRFQLLRVVVHLPHKPVRFLYADDGTQLVKVASAQDVYEVNDREGLKLDASQVPAYLRFFLACTTTGLSALRLAEREEDALWVDAADYDSSLKPLKQQAMTLIHPALVTPLPDGGYRVVATAIEQRILKQLILRISVSGRVETDNQTVLLEDIPVPYMGF